MRVLRRIGLVLLAVIGVLAISAAILAIAPTPQVTPALAVNELSPAAASADFDDLIAADNADVTVLPECVSERVEPTGTQRGVIVLFHGYTSCPNQFRDLAQALAAEGYEVLVPRMPNHGITDVIVEPAAVDLNAFAKWGMGILDIASALDSNVTVGGLSGGATLSLWLATQRTDIDHVVAIAPMLSPAVVPDPLRHLATNLIAVLPDIAVWWDFTLLEKDQVPRYSYAQFLTRSIGSLMAMGIEAERASSNAPVVYLVNAADESISNGLVLADAQRDLADGTPTTAYELPASLGAPHEYVDEDDPANKLEQTLPGLVEVFTTGATTELGAKVVG